MCAISRKCCPTGNGCGDSHLGVCIRELRIALYEGNVKKVEEVMADLERFFPTDLGRCQFQELVSPFDRNGSQLTKVVQGHGARPIDDPGNGGPGAHGALYPVFRRTG